MKKVAVSGAFDPLTLECVRHIREAAKLGDVYVILNSDSWMHRNHRLIHSTWERRAGILREIKGVKDVLMANDADDTVSHNLKELYPNYFAKGGHRTKANTPEVELCKQLCIEMVWGVGDV